MFTPAFYRRPLHRSTQPDRRVDHSFDYRFLASSSLNSTLPV